MSHSNTVPDTMPKTMARVPLCGNELGTPRCEGVWHRAVDRLKIVSNKRTCKLTQIPCGNNVTGDYFWSCQVKRNSWHTMETLGPTVPTWPITHTSGVLPWYPTCHPHPHIDPVSGWWYRSKYKQGFWMAGLVFVGPRRWQLVLTNDALQERTSFLR